MKQRREVSVKSDDFENHQDQVLVSRRRDQVSFGAPNVFESTFESQLQVLEKIERKKKKLSKLLVKGSFAAENISLLAKTQFQALIEILNSEMIAALRLSHCKISAKKLAEVLQICDNCQMVCLQHL